MKKKERKYVQTRMKVKDNIGGLLVGNDGPKVFAVEERVVLDLGEHVEVAHARQVHERDADVEARLARERKLGRRVVVARGRLDAVGSDAGYLLVVEAAEQRPQLADIGPHEQVQVEQDQRVHVLKATLQQPSSLELEISNIHNKRRRIRRNHFKVKPLDSARLGVAPEAGRVRLVVVVERRIEAHRHVVSHALGEIFELKIRHQ